ncbi:hypothetical protein JCM13267_00220 [Howardella ureilytica]
MTIRKKKEQNNSLVITQKIKNKIIQSGLNTVFEPLFLLMKTSFVYILFASFGMCIQISV